MPSQSLQPTLVDDAADILDNRIPAEGSAAPQALASIPAVSVDHLAGIESVTSLLTQDHPLERVLSKVAEDSRKLLKCESTAVCLLSEGKTLLDFAAVAGVGSKEMSGQRVFVDDALPGSTALSGKPLLAFNEALHLESSAGVNQSFKPAGVRSAAIVPIMVGDESIGAIAAIDKSDGKSFTGTDLLTLQLLSSVASSSIQQDHLGRTAAQRTRERNILFRVAQNSARSFDTEDILNSTLEALIGSIEMASAMVFLFSDDRSVLYIAASYGISDDESEIQISAESDFANAVLADGGSALIIDERAISETYFDVFPPSYTGPNSAMIVPLITRDGVAGVMVVTSRLNHAYNQDDLALLAAVASQTAVKIDNGFLFEDATRRASEATAVYELSQALNSSLSVSSVAQIAVDSIAPLLRVDKCALFLYNPLRNRLDIVAARNLSVDAVEKMHPNPEHRGVAWWVYEFETPTSVVDVAADNRNRSYPIEGEGAASLLSVPLQAGDNVIGVVHAMSSRRRSFTVGEMELLFTVGNQVGSAIEKALVLEETRRQHNDLRRSFRRVTRALSTSSSPELTEHVVTELAAELIKVDRAVLYRFSNSALTGGSAKLIPVASYGFKLPDSSSVNAVIDSHQIEHETTAQTVARKKRVIIIEENAINDPRFIPSELIAGKVARANFYLGLPLTIGDQMLGVIEVYAREPRKVSRADMRNVLAFVSQAAIALKTSWAADSMD